MGPNVNNSKINVILTEQIIMQCKHLQLSISDLYRGSKYPCDICAHICSIYILVCRYNTFTLVVMEKVYYPTYFCFSTVRLPLMNYFNASDAQQCKMLYELNRTERNFTMFVFIVMI